MNWQLSLRIFTLFLSVSACRTVVKGQSVVRADSADSGGSSEARCDDIHGESSAKDFNGEQVFALSTRCVFNQELHEIRIRILGETFQKVVNDGCADRDSGFGHVEELIFDGHHIKNVGIKVRGNTSKCSPKRQFKFKFDAKEMFAVWQGTKQLKDFPENKHRRFFGLAGYSVRASANDPSMIRENLSSNVFSQIAKVKPTSIQGPLVYQLSFAKFFVSFNRTQQEGPEGSFNRLIDGNFYDYKGLYSVAENVDEVFVESRFENAEKKVKKPSLFQADLAKAQFSRDKYTRKGWSQKLIEGDEPENDADGSLGDNLLFQLFDQLTDSASEDDLAKTIDIDSVVNYTAGAILTGHWDSMLANRNNDFLYIDDTENKWKIIAWDLDNSLGGLLHDLYTSMMSNDIFHPAEKSRSRLFEVIFSESHPNFRAMLKERLGSLLTGYYEQSAFNGAVDRRKGLVTGAAEAWEGINDEYFNNIKDFAQSRRNKIGSQIGQ